MLERIVIEPSTVIEDSLGMAIAGMQFPSSLESTDSTVIIDTLDGSITFRFYFTFPSVSAALSFSDLLVVFHCENSEGEATKSLKVRHYGNCSKPATAGFPASNVNLSTKDSIVTVKINLGDDDTDDYPSNPISVYLNGTWMLRDHIFVKAENYYWTIKPNSTNEMLVICTSNSARIDNFCTVYFNGWHTVKCNLDPGQGRVIHIF